MILIFLILKTFSIEADSSFINYLKRTTTIISYYTRTSSALTWSWVVIIKINLNIFLKLCIITTVQGVREGCKETGFGVERNKLKVKL